MNVFDLQGVALQDVNLIEASAGTGKTYTLAGLYLRLILEQELEVRDILVVTYTRAATQELRDRLRKKLSEARQNLLRQPDDNVREVRLLNRAIQSFDEAAINTIHSFCQQVLKDFAFESGSRFDMELVGDDSELLQDVADDFWRREVVQADSDFSAYLLARKQSPETLLASIRSLVGKPYLHIQPLPELDESALKQALDSAFSYCAGRWRHEYQQVTAFLQGGELKKTSYAVQKVASLLESLESLFNQDTPPAELVPSFELLMPETLKQKGLKKGASLPELGFWSACETLQQCYQELEALRSLQLQNLRMALLAAIRVQLPRQKARQRLMAYDDLLLNLSEALQGPQSEALIASLRGRFKAALIDEFQDTDPVQYGNFRHVFAGSGLPVFFVGDPKQAIYSFRGADIFTYLDAKADARHSYTLGKNWRSHHSLVTAINHVFQRQAHPFIYEDIPFIPVDAARNGPPSLQIDEDESAALQIVYADSEKPMNKGMGAEMANIAVNATADEIARLLNLAADDRARLVDEEQHSSRPLYGGDIAVLVPTHNQAQLVQEALRLRGINSVQQGRENVFASSQADDMQCLLQALNRPDHSQRLATVLAGPLFHYPASALHAVQQDELRWSDLIAFMQSLQRRWLEHGFMAMFRSVLQYNDTLQRLLALPDGERRLTNYLHLAELIQAESLRQNHRIEVVSQWLARQRECSDAEDETAQLRLESDEELVKIMTIHSSKGLEYPIVFCPFSWTVRGNRATPAIVEYHDPEQGHRPSAALTGAELDRALELAGQEKQAEALRLLYVALTRARERCVIVWGKVKDVQQSALYRLLHATECDMRADLDELAAGCAHIAVIDYQPQPPLHYRPRQDSAPRYQARPFTGTIRAPWRIGSFSLLSSGQSSEQPDYDADHAEPTADPIHRRGGRDRFSFERGRQAGNFLHKCLEQIDFQTPGTTHIATVVERLLPHFGMEANWSEVAVGWLREVLDTPLGPDGPRLCELGRAQRVNEMAFHFPVAGLELKSLRTLLQQTPVDTLWRRLAAELQFRDLSGFMKGFIDLVFEHKGRFYIADYKSNHLGAARQHYEDDALERAMLSHTYPLQYLIYSLALHRHLKLRVPDYAPSRHFGGVYYLFIRGMAPEWGQAGVYFDPVDRALLAGLDALMAGEA